MTARVVLQLRVDKEVRDELKAESRRTGLSVNAIANLRLRFLRLLNDAGSEFLAAKEGRAQPPTPVPQPFDSTVPSRTHGPVRRGLS